jgi:hypothetical protein
MRRFFRRIHGELEIPAAVSIRTLFGDILRSTPNSPRPTPTRTKAAGAALIPLAGVTCRPSGPTWPHRTHEERLASSPSCGREQGVHRGARCVLDVGWPGYERSSRSAGLPEAAGQRRRSQVYLVGIQGASLLLEASVVFCSTAHSVARRARHVQRATSGSTTSSMATGRSGVHAIVRSRLRPPACLPQLDGTSAAAASLPRAPSHSPSWRVETCACETPWPRATGVRPAPRVAKQIACMRACQSEIC